MPNRDPRRFRFSRRLWTPHFPGRRAMSLEVIFRTDFGFGRSQIPPTVLEAGITPFSILPLALPLLQSASALRPPKQRRHPPWATYILGLDDSPVMHKSTSPPRIPLSLLRLRSFCFQPITTARSSPQTTSPSCMYLHPYLQTRSLMAARFLHLLISSTASSRLEFATYLGVMVRYRFPGHSI